MCLLNNTYSVRTAQEISLRYKSQTFNAIRGNSRYLLWETQGILKYTSKLYTNSVLTSQETQYVSARKARRLMLCREQSLFIVRTLRNTQIHFQIIYKNPVRTSQETHYISAREPIRLMLFGETVSVYCVNHTEHTDTLWVVCWVI
jgi:hypothetical protein